MQLLTSDSSKPIFRLAALSLAILNVSAYAAETTSPKNILPTIVVNAEATDNYTVKSTSSTTKLDLSLKETPQSISIITQQQIEDQNLQDIHDILMQTSGVSIGQYGHKNGGNVVFNARGMRIVNFQRDGVPTTGFGEYIGVESSDIYERIEVIRGSTGLTNGSGNPSASLNYVRKKPTADFRGNAKLSYGSWDTYKGMLDVSGGLNTDKSIRGRLVTSYGEGHSQQDRYGEDNRLLYGALDIDLSDNTLLTTALNYQKTNTDNLSSNGWGYVTNDTPQQKTNYGKKDNPAADWTHNNIEKLNLFLGLEHNFNDDWKAIANYSYTKAEADRANGVVSGISYNTDIPASRLPAYGAGQMIVSEGKSLETPETHALDLYTTGNINAFNRKHKLSFGINGYETKASDPSYKTNYYVVPIAGWNGHVANRQPIIETGKSESSTKEFGAFAAINLELAEPLHLILGSRVTHFDRVNNKGTATEKNQKYNAEVTPYAGLTYDINNNFTTYVSYTSIFNPTSTNEDDNGNYLDPEQGNTFELGLKSDFYDGKLNTSLAYFVTKQDNFAIIDTSFPTGYLNKNGKTPYTTTDGAEIKGWDLSIGGEILPNWNINGGYTYTDAKNKDKKPLNTSMPKQTFKVFSNYKYHQLTVGGGLNWQSEISSPWAVTDLDKSLQRQKSYTLVNAMAKYDVNPDVSVLFNVNNMLNKKYSVSPSMPNYGDERNYTLSLNYKF